MTNKDFDKWIAEHIMGWQSTGPHWINTNNIFKAYADEIVAGTHYDNEWNPTESISDAFQVVEKMMEKFPDWFFTLDVFGDNYTGKDRAVATFQESAEAYIIYSCEGAKTMPLAICLAAKKAIEEMR